MLFTGDATALDEALFCTEALKNMLPEEGVTVLKAAHHGSSTSTSELLLDTVSPETVLISCGRGNPYGHPHEEVLERLKARSIEIRQTQAEGEIELGFRTDSS